MSIIDAAIPYIAGFASALVPGLISSRNIAGFVADLTLSEHHKDTNVITQHPVETGSVISDHVYALPQQVLIQVGYSNSSLNAMADSNYVQSIYQNFLSLMNSKTPFSVTTGKRNYDNMLIEHITEFTDEKTENALFLEIACLQLIFANTQTVSTSGMSSDPSNQSNPGSTAPVSQQGAQQLSSANGVNNQALYNANIPPTAVLQ